MPSYLLATNYSRSDVFVCSVHCDNVLLKSRARTITDSMIFFCVMTAIESHIQYWGHANVCNVFLCLQDNGDEMFVFIVYQTTHIKLYKN